MIADALRHALLNLEVGYAYRVGEGHRVGTAVALDDDAAHAEEARAVVTAWVQLAAQRPQHGHGRQGREPGPDTALELLAHIVGNEQGHAFAGLESDIAH